VSLATDNDTNTGIGISPDERYKLRILCDTGDGCGDGDEAFGLFSRAFGNFLEGFGVYAVGEGDASAEDVTGVYGRAFGAEFDNYGVRGVAGSGANETWNVGVRGSATGGSSINRGVWGSASGSNNFRGYFTDGVFISGGISTPSDERLKTNIVDLDGADILTRIGNLFPKRFEFQSDAELRQQNLPALGASDSERFGIMAQELEQVFPELVSESIHVLVDETGNRIKDADPVIIKAVNYEDLIPVLVAAINELQAEIDELKQRLDQAGF
jgi:hypothetical protein